MIREKRQFSFLLPAVLTAALVFHMLPQTQMMLRAIPERLQLVAETGAKESPVKRRTADGGNGAETLPAAEGAFEDGVYTGSSRGYGGDITVQVTVENSRITDVRTLSAPGETEPYFSLAASLLDTVKKAQSWEVDAVSGATYSSRGILGAIRNALTGETVENEKPESVDPVGTTSQDIFKDPAAYKDGTYYGTADGFGGPITVEVVIKDGKIAGIRVVSAPDETGDYLSRAKGVLSRILKKGSPNVDAVSGATYSSTGIINAVKRALSKAASDGKEELSGMAESNKLKAPLAILRAADPDEYEDGTYYGIADGFGGEIKVKVVIIDGKIDSISVESAPGETEKYMEMAKGVIPKILKAGSSEVDAVSGATFSSTGIIEAVRQALRQAAKEPEEGGEGGEGGSEGGEGGSEGGEGGSEGGEGGSEGGGTTAIRYEDGTYTGSGWCDDGEEFYYEIHVSIRVADGKIASVSVAKGEDDSDSPEDNDFYLNWAVNGRTRAGVFYPGVPAQIVEKQNVEVDTVSGATYSSSTIRSVAAQVISGIPKAKAAEEEPAQENAEPAGTANTAPKEVEEPETAAEEKPETAAEEEPETAAEEEPETTAEEEPETTAEEEPDITAEEEPETTTEEEPETTAEEEPETMAEEEPDIAAEEEPETTTEEEKGTTDTEEPEQAGSGETGGNGS